MKSVHTTKKCYPPILVYPDYTKAFILTTDTSNEALGAVLSQGKIEDEKHIEFASKALNDAGKRYSTIEKEFLGIVWATKQFRHYLLQRHFKINTDHQPLRGISNLKDQTSRLAKFRHKLSEYDFEILYKPGKTNFNADALSRLPLHQSETLTVQTRSMDKAAGKVENSGEVELEEPDRGGRGVRILTDPAEIKTIIRDYHDSVLGGHVGVKKTTTRISKSFRWKGMHKQIKQYVLNCPKCQINKSSKLTRMQLTLTYTPNKPFDKVYMDIVGILPATTSGNKY